MQSYRAKQRGFTLVELVTVAGITAVLMALLVPALCRARRSAQQIVCLSNMRQIGTAFVMYENDNRQQFPRPAAAPTPEDWIYWQPYRDVSQSRIAPYLSQPFSTAILCCPADDLSAHVYSYPYSYSVNYYVCLSVPQTPLKVTQIFNPSQKILVVCESALTVDDGCWASGYFFNYMRSPSNMVSARHDTNCDSLDDPTSGHGNVVFVDGHGEFLQRANVFNPSYFDPSVP